MTKFIFTGTSTSTGSTAAANVSISALVQQAQSLFVQAQKYREEMEKLAENDPTRDVYEKTILDLLSRAKSLSHTVTTAAAKST